MNAAALDGNAVAGPLLEIFGREMTTAVGKCRGCGEDSNVAQWKVYKGPGIVLRCPFCTYVLMTLLPHGRMFGVDAQGVEWEPRRQR